MKDSIVIQQDSDDTQIKKTQANLSNDFENPMALFDQRISRIDNLIEKEMMSDSNLINFAHALQSSEHSPHRSQVQSGQQLRNNDIQKINSHNVNSDQKQRLKV